MHDTHVLRDGRIVAEPLRGLGLGTRVRIVDLLVSLCAERDLTILLVSHDLGVVTELCAHTAVLEHGRLVEQGNTDAVLGAPAHPYTRKLLSSVPRLP
ncbi:ABC transporter ATP-binding protein [Actinoplanes derwentensis]